MKDVTPKAHRCTFGGCPAILEVTPQDLRCMGGACPSLFEVTPEAMRCEIATSCPAVFEVTPEPMRCGTSFSSCPAIYEQQDGNIVIGKIMGFLPQKADREAMLSRVPEEIRPRIGPDEFAVWVPRGLVKPGDE